MWKVLCLLLPFVAFAFSKTIYPLSPEPIDVLIPCHPKDRGSLHQCIKGIRKNGVNIRRIIVISEEPLITEAEWFDEKNYPFTKEDLLLELDKVPRSRIGWIYQQLLKLYAFLVIPRLSSNLLVLDADTIFLQPVLFLTSNGQPLFCNGEEHHQPYFDHAKKLLPEFKKVFPRYSGICHHMIFQRPILQDLFSQIAKIHSLEPWKIICRLIDPSEGSSFSEYELYFNFVFARTDQATLRKLKWKNIDSLDEIKKYKKRGYDFVSCHVY